MACQTFPPAPYQVCGAILDKYNELGGTSSFLLWPTSDELTNPDGVGKRSVFMNGPIYWHPDAGAHPVANHFFACWQRNGWEGGPLRYPTSDELVNPDGIGRRQYFQGGTIYWKLNEAYFVGGAIRDKWGETGWEQGWLGYPTSDEVILPDGQGRMNRFEHGVIYWSPTTGAHPVAGTILDQWASAGYERSSLGYPVADAVISTGGVEEQQFQNGRLFSSGMRLALTSSDSVLSFGVPTSVALTHESTSDMVVFHGDGYDLTFRTRSETSAELGINLLAPQAPREFTLLLPIPPGFALQAQLGRVNLLAPDGSVTAAVGLPVAVDAVGALVDVVASVAGNALTFQFEPSTILPIQSLAEGVTKNVNDYSSVGENQRNVCLTNPTDCQRAYPARDLAQKISSEEFPGPDQGDNRADAARHCLWQAFTTEMANKDFALRLANAHEQDAPGAPESNAMDEYNNVTGRAVGLRFEGNLQGIITTSLGYAHEARIVPNPVGLENEDGNDLIILHE
ncbi:hypothetical protein NN3_01160 [Nocardia neocaledoniensis NBRC 108232]|uniref:LGFP repeat-containing protein n=1 Tax=Nocardia neocaledoniensis TaxID=236511 RepID=A0A317NG73_9NOCA|nr:LGFP repeat-containing protein [Nocardia neocaledoniensis]PWV74396.1 LGFP repeat-containing protein [Nocardia neocaledoniensis]GEM29109.1 hypothetical protein NN3_01160 [Nocardia neocaledoniensis NBRC 108232]